MLCAVSNGVLCAVLCCAVLCANCAVCAYMRAVRVCMCACAYLIVCVLYAVCGSAIDMPNEELDMRFRSRIAK